VEKGRRVSASNCPPATIKDTINRASDIRFAYAEYNRNDDLVLTTVGDLLAEPAMANKRSMTKDLNDIGIYGFNISLDIPTINIVVNSVPLAAIEGRDREPMAGDIDSPAWSELENELTSFNPELWLMDRPKQIKCVSALEAEKKEKSSIIVAVEINEWVSEELKKPHPALAIYGLRCSIRKYIRKDASTHCKRCLQHGHYGGHCRSLASCKYRENSHHTKDHLCGPLYCTAGTGRP